MNQADENWNRRASPASASEGWKLVPVEPTEEMVNAFKSADLTELRRYGVTISRLLVRFTQNYRAMLAAAPTPPENKALLEAVAEVVWYDPQLSHFPEKPGKIIDGSIAFMESAEIGTKLFSAPTPPVSEDRKDAERYRWLRDIGNNTWKSMIKRGITATQCDSAIDAEIVAMQEDKP